MGAIIFFLLSSVPFFSEKGVMTCIIDNRQNEHIYKQPEYNFMEYCVPDKFAEFFKNSCEKPFIMTISESMKHNTLKYFWHKVE